MGTWCMLHRASKVRFCRGWGMGEGKLNIFLMKHSCFSEVSETYQTCVSQKVAKQDLPRGGGIWQLDEGGIFPHRASFLTEIGQGGVSDIFPSLQAVLASVKRAGKREGRQVGRKPRTVRPASYDAPQPKTEQSSSPREGESAFHASSETIELFPPSYSSSDRAPTPTPTPPSSPPPFHPLPLLFAPCLAVYERAVLIADN